MTDYDELKHYDEYGMICMRTRNSQGQPWHDGGDSGHRMGNFYTMIKVGEQIGAIPKDEFFKQDTVNYENALVHFFIDGNFIRHPDPKIWYSQPDRGSRDLFVPNIIALGALGLKKELWKAFKAHLKRGLLFTTNTRKNQSPADAPPEKMPLKLPDLTLFEFWTYYIRGFNLWFLYPLLCVLDFEFFVNAIIRRFNDDNDVNNFITNAAYVRIKYPTPLSWLALKITSRSDMAKKSYDYHKKFKFDEGFGSPEFVGAAMRLVGNKIFGRR